MPPNRRYPTDSIAVILGVFVAGKAIRLQSTGATIELIVTKMARHRVPNFVANRAGDNSLVTLE
jgi:hypothetical protein